MPNHKDAAQMRVLRSSFAGKTSPGRQAQGDIGRVTPYLSSNVDAIDSVFIADWRLVVAATTQIRTRNGHKHSSAAVYLAHFTFMHNAKYV